MATKLKTTTQPQITSDTTEAAKKRKMGELAKASLQTDGGLNQVVVEVYAPDKTTDIETKMESISRQLTAIQKGEFAQLENMLATQAMALQAMFVDLACRAKDTTNREWLQTYTTLAMKCQAQSRQAITALAELRMPKAVLFAKQANVTTGPQQVNNGAPTPAARAHAENSRNPRNELLEATDGNWLDTRTTGQAGRLDQVLAPVGAVHRAQYEGR